MESSRGSGRSRKVPVEAQPNSTTMTDADGPVRVEADAAAVASKAREGSPSVDLAKTRDRAVPTGSVSGSASHLEQGGSVSVTDKVDAISSSDNGMIANGKDDIRAASLDDLEASTVSPSSSRLVHILSKTGEESHGNVGSVNALDPTAGERGCRNDEEGFVAQEASPFADRLRKSQAQHRTEPEPWFPRSTRANLDSRINQDPGDSLVRGFSNNLKISQPLETDKSRSTDNKISLKVLSGCGKDSSHRPKLSGIGGEAMNEYWSHLYLVENDEFSGFAVDHDLKTESNQIQGAVDERDDEGNLCKEGQVPLVPDRSIHVIPPSCGATSGGHLSWRRASSGSNQGQVGMYNWQSTKMTVKERLAFMFNNEILADVHFLVGRENQQQRIPAHRFILSVGSAVFDAMFNSGLARKDDNDIPLPDVEPASFLVLLRFLYSDEVQIGPETVMTTLYTAKKYAVPALEKHCVDFLKRNLAADNAFMLLTQARLFDEPQLAALCLETIDKYTPEALGAEGFIDIDIDTLAAVLDRDSLRIKEAKLFSAILRWSEAECMRQGLPVTPENKRSVLGHVLTKVRFPLMTVEEFAQGPAQSGILTDRECVSLFLHFTVNPKPPVAFLDVPRCSMTGKEQIVKRFQQIESRWGYSGTSDKIRFVVDRRIFVVGFGLYGSIHGPSEYQVTIQLYHTSSGRLLGTNETGFSSDGSNSTFRVMFKEPIEVLPNTNYTASATLKGLDSHYGTKGMRKLWVDCPSGGKINFSFSYAAGNNNGTSVEDGQIPEIIFYT